MIESICLGKIPWHLVFPFPEQGLQDEMLGDSAVREIRGCLDEVPHTYGDLTADDGRRWADRLRSSGYLNLLSPPDIGGLGLTPYNAFRVIAEASRPATAIGLMLAAHNGFGAAAYIPVLPPGRLRDHLSERVASGAITGMADTEPTGASNKKRFTVARRNGGSYILDGQKLHIGNGPIADVLAVTATLEGRVRVFFVDARAAGVKATAQHTYMGLRGFPIASLELRGVRVPEDFVLNEDTEAWLSTERAAVLSRGRLYSIAAPALAIARQSLGLAREYALRRNVDDRPLSTFSEIQRSFASSLADVWALETVTQWTMLGDQGDESINLMPEQYAAKNITSLLCWRVAERSMTLMAGEGYETAEAKANRGAAPASMERLFRDARGLRIAGGTELLLHNRLADRIALACFDADENATYKPIAPVASALTSINQEHLKAAAIEVSRFSDHCRGLLIRHPKPGSRAHIGRELTNLGRVLEELVTMVLVLARSATGAGAAPGTLRLCDLYCRSARRRLLAYWSAIEDSAVGDEVDYEAICAPWIQRAEV